MHKPDTRNHWLTTNQNLTDQLTQNMHVYDVEQLTSESPFIYILQPSASYTPRMLNVIVQKVTRTKNGDIIAAKVWSSYHDVLHSKDFLPEDKLLIGALHTQRSANNSVMSFGQQNITHLSADILQKMAQTGRFYWLNHQDNKINWCHEANNLEFVWQTQQDGQTVQLTARWLELNGSFSIIHSDGLYLIQSEPPSYFDRNTGRMGGLSTQYPFDTLSHLIQTPDLPLSMMTEFEHTENILSGTVLSAPTSIERVNHYGDAQAVLIFCAPPSGWVSPTDDLIYGFARVVFEYEGGAVEYTRSGESFPGIINGIHVIQHRDCEQEQSMLRQLMLQMPELQNIHLNHHNGNKKAILDVLSAPFLTWLDALNTPDFFTQKGWEVRHAPDSPLNIHHASAPKLELNEHLEVNNDWFSLGMTIEANGKHYNLNELLGSMIDTQPLLLDSKSLAEIDDDTLLFARAADATKIALRMGDVRLILVHLTDLFDYPTREGKIQLDQYDAMRLLGLRHAIGFAYGGSARLQHLLDVFHQGMAQELVAPEQFNGILRPYQEKGLAWLQFLRESEHGGILADDMGLGKTAQTLAHILFEKDAGRLDKPVLIVAPTSLMHNWLAEATRFTPTLKVLILQGTERSIHFERIIEHDIVLTTYPLLPRDETILLAYEYHMVILDEAQNIKNPIAKAAQVARKLRTCHRLCLTGTPMENHLGELWSLFHFLMPGFLGSEDHFNKRFRYPIEKRGDVAAQKALVARIRPFMLRRRKIEVATELPPKTTTVVHIDMNSAQQKLYEAIRAAMQVQIQLKIAEKGFRRSHIDILDALLKLRQVCCHPILLKMGSVKKDIESAKLKVLIEMVSEMVAEGRRILIFSQFTSMLNLIESALTKQNIEYAILTGQTNRREVVINSFQNGHVPVFLISLKAGGVGLNLTAADTVIHYDPWWNPATEEQASDRAWRIGQDKPVFVYKLVITGSIEERIVEMQQRKANLANSVMLDDSEYAVKFSEEDLMSLLAPFEDT